MFVYPIVIDLLAQNAEERKRPLQLILDTTKYIVDNNFYLIDVTGKPTKWGVWNPSELNLDHFWYDGRGLNSL